MPGVQKNFRESARGRVAFFGRKHHRGKLLRDGQHLERRPALVTRHLDAARFKRGNLLVDKPALAIAHAAHGLLIERGGNAATVKPAPRTAPHSNRVAGDGMSQTDADVAMGVACGIARLDVIDVHALDEATRATLDFAAAHGAARQHVHDHVDRAFVARQRAP